MGAAAKNELKAEFVVVWEFLVRTRKRSEFERIYGPEGTWAKLFRSGKGYIRTELIRDVATPSRYLRLDFWMSRKAYTRFKTENRRKYHAIDEGCASLTEAEVLIGEFHKST